MLLREEYVTIWREAFGLEWFNAKDVARVNGKHAGASPGSHYHHLNMLVKDGILERQERPARFYYRFKATEPAAISHTNKDAWKAAVKDLVKMLPKTVVSIYINASTGEVTVTQEVVKVDQESYTL